MVQVTKVKIAFLSYLRLSIYMAVVSIAITLSFHVKHQPTNFELRMAKPLGAVFWALSVVMLLLGFGNYIRKSLFPLLVLTPLGYCSDGV